MEQNTANIEEEINLLVQARSIEDGTCGRRPYINRILLGDCSELLQWLPDGCVDLIVTDPPYGVRYRDRSGRTLLNDNNTRWILPAFSQAYRVLKNDAFCVSFYGWNHVDRFLAAWRTCGFRPVGHFTWVKSYSSKVGFTGAWHECAYLLVKGNPSKPANPPPDVLPWKYSGNKLHPTQKPVSALRPVIEAYSTPGDLVLDPFAGSGSTAVAAKLCKRRFLLIEKDEEYFYAARARMLKGTLE